MSSTFCTFSEMSAFFKSGISEIPGNLVEVKHVPAHSSQVLGAPTLVGATSPYPSLRGERCC